MRLVGLTLCLLASSFGARAESVEDRMAALEQRVKVLEEALRGQSAAPALNGSVSAIFDTMPPRLCIKGGDPASDKIALIHPSNLPTPHLAPCGVILTGS